jgi:hypothetical protein
MSMFGNRLLKKFGVGKKIDAKKLSNGLSFGETLNLLKVEAHKQKPAGVINSSEYFSTIDSCVDNLDLEFKKITDGKKEDPKEE